MNLQRILIASAQEDFEFPLAEAVRKQIFQEAKGLRASGHEVHILIVSPGDRHQETRDDIEIRVVQKTDLLAMGLFLARFDLIHFWGTTGIVAMLVSLMAPLKRKILTFTDGAVFATGGNVSGRRYLAKLLYYFYDQFRVYTEYQRDILLSVSRRFERKLGSKLPTLEDTQPVLPEKSDVPILLYMGHLSWFKGVDVVIEVFRRLSSDFPDLRLILADNGLVYDDGCREATEKLAEDYPERVILKGKVYPYEEISRAHLLIHPLRQHGGTFAFPLSLYECLLCGTPFLSTALEGLMEFFDEHFLCEKDSVESFTARARMILSEPSQTAEKVSSNLIRIRETMSTGEPVSVVRETV